MKRHARTAFALYLATLSGVTAYAQAKPGAEMPGLSFPLVLRSASVQVSIRENASFEICTADGKPLLDIQGLSLRGEVRGETLPEGEVEILEGAHPAVRITYGLGDIVTGKEAVPVKEKPVVSAVLNVYPRYVDLEWLITGVPATNPKASLDSTMVRRTVSGLIETIEQKCSFWKRHDSGGVPFEVPAGVLQAYPAADTPFVMAYKGRLNTRWKETKRGHAAVQFVEPGIFRSRMAIFPGDLRSPVCKQVLGAWEGRRYGVTFEDLPLYGLWESKPGKETELSFAARLDSGHETSRKVLLHAWIRDWDGRLLHEERKEIVLPGLGGIAHPVSCTVPEPRGIYFAEVSVRDPETGEEAFRRTNLSVLPPHAFKTTPDTSIFGIAAYWPIPDEESVQRLMDRMGVRWIRMGDTRLQHAPRIAMRQTRMNWSNTNKADRLAFLEKEFKALAENENGFWEVGNESNMSTLGIAMEGGGIGKALQAPAYSDFIRFLFEERKKHPEWQPVQILSQGLAGMDIPFTEKMKECGALDLIDGFCLHPGRGNFTPDYPVIRPWEEWKGRNGGNYWNYYASLKDARLTLRKLGRPELPLYLTEVYAPTYPNSYWEDSYRNAAENTFLSLVLAQAEGVKAAFWYQLFDTVWFDRFGVNPKNREYHFGLVQRDLSLKPSALGYIAAAETLEGAVFRGWVQFEDGAIRGMEWTSPRGPFYILWSRADGYVLTERKSPYASPEPWVDCWKTRTAVTLPARGEQVELTDCIGRATTLPVTDGTVRIELTGAPVVLRGLAALPLH
ncbi:MAG: hypothetical protein ACI4QT_01550 [Kiritimatiellia bacterium]